MTDEILIVESTVEEIEVKEFTGAPTSTVITTDHGYGKGEQHPITDITGLKTKLDNLEALKDTIYTKRTGYAEYCLWDEEATENNPLAPGYFVRISRILESVNGNYEKYVRKCEGEEIEVQTTLPLETKPVVVDNNEVWSAVDKIQTNIYYVTATETYYNYEIDTWVSYTKDEYKEITLDKILMKYAYVGEIKTKDISKYYVVGACNNQTKQWIEPCDIFAYNGIEYVKKPAYSYKNGGVYKNALMDVFGVTVPPHTTSLVGNQTEVPKSDETMYALVATTGVVDVLCDHEVVVGDYVQPYAAGWAKKSTGSYGYLVTALVQNSKVVSTINPNELLYARITLTPSIVLAKEASNNIDSLLETTRRLDANIISFGNTANEAKSTADEALELAKGYANNAATNAESASKDAQSSSTSASDAWKESEKASVSASKAAEEAKKAAEAVADARAYIAEQREEIIQETNESLALAVKNNNLEVLRSLEYKLNGYSVGKHSQAYGLTISQAKSILPVNSEAGNVVFIPLYAGNKTLDTEVYSTIPTVSVERNDGKIYWKFNNMVTEVAEDGRLTFADIITNIEVTDITATPVVTRKEGHWCINDIDSGYVAIDDIQQEFTESYSYIWTNNGWLKEQTYPNVLFGDTPKQRPDTGDYWYVPLSYEGMDFERGALYCYKEEAWTQIATLDENAVSRTVAHINHLGDEITQAVTGLEGQMSTLQTKVDKDGAKTSMFASTPVELKDKKPVNYQELDKFSTYDDLNTDENKKRAKAILDAQNSLYYDNKYKCVYYCIGDNLPYTVYKATLDGATVKITKEDAVTYDGDDLYRINTAGIVAAVNNDGENLITLTADQINFDGSTTFVDALNDQLGENGGTTINGSRIATGTIDASCVNADFATALNLEVGNQVTMGANARISWNQVDDKDDVATTADIPTDEHITSITRTEISTAKISADNITAGTIDANDVNIINVKADTIDATTGSIGGWDINENSISREYDGWSTSLYGPNDTSNSKVIDIGTDGTTVYAGVRISSTDNTKYIIKIYKDQSTGETLDLAKDITLEISAFYSKDGIVGKYSTEVYLQAGKPEYTYNFPTTVNNSSVDFWCGVYFSKYHIVTTPQVTTDRFTQTGYIEITLKIEGNKIVAYQNDEEYYTSVNIDVDYYYWISLEDGSISDPISASTVILPGESSTIVEYDNLDHFSFNDEWSNPEYERYYDKKEVTQTYVAKLSIENNKVFVKTYKYSNATTPSSLLITKFFNVYHTNTPKTVSIQEGNSSVSYEINDFSCIALNSVATPGRQAQTFGASNPFYVTQQGELYAENAVIKGEIEATSGTIGGLTITNNSLVCKDNDLPLYVLDEKGLLLEKKSAKIQVGDVSLEYNEDQQATYIKANGPLILQGSNSTQLEFMRRSTSDTRYIEITADSSISKDSGNNTTVIFNINSNKVLYYDITFTISYYYIQKYAFGESDPYYGTRTYTIKSGESLTKGYLELGYGTFEVYIQDINGSYAMGTRTVYTTSQSISNENLYTTGNFLPNTDDKYILGGENNKWKQIYAVTSTINTSDKNEKKNILSLSDKYSCFFDKLNPVTYKFIQNDSDRTHIGFIAQDIEQALTDVGLTTKDFAGICYWDKEDGTKGYGLRYEEFVPLNTLEIQKLKKRVTEQDKLISDLTSRLEALEEKLK